MPDAPRMQHESSYLPFNENEFPEIPVDLSFSQYRISNGCLDAYFEEERMPEEMLSAASVDCYNSEVYYSFLDGTFADILNEGCYEEPENTIPFMEELEHHNYCLLEAPNSSLDHGGTEIQIHSDSPMLQSHQQGSLFDGTTAKRVCMKLQKQNETKRIEL